MTPPTKIRTTKASRANAQPKGSDLDASPVALSEVFDPEAFRALALSGYALPDDLPWESMDKGQEA